MIHIYIELGVSNYYGTVVAVQSGEKYYLELDDYSGVSRNEISEEFFNAINKEFGIDNKDSL